MHYTRITKPESLNIKDYYILIDLWNSRHDLGKYKHISYRVVYFENLSYTINSIFHSGRTLIKVSFQLKELESFIGESGLPPNV